MSDNIDPQTLAVAVQIFLDDLNEFQSNRKGKNRQDDVTDEDIAMDAWQAELQAISQQFMDRALCESIAHAVEQDADLIGVAVQEDIQAAEDRNMALRMSNAKEAAGVSRPSTPALPELDNKLEAKLRELNLSPSTQSAKGSVTVPRVAAESSSSAAERFSQKFRPVQSNPHVVCIACGDRLPLENTHRVPCDHDYCHGCIESLITASIADESLFPPRCCNQPLALLDRNSEPFDFIPEALYSQFYSKKEEFETVNRTYCHIATCSQFLSTKTDIRADIGTCPSCYVSTCTICKGATHNGPCPEDAASQDVLRIAQENGWQQCFGCKRLVELDTGCNHMTCICGAQFCYVCGVKWRECRCPQWNEERLYARAEAVVNRDRNIHVLDRADMIRREQDNLVANHQCAHANWGSRQGRYQCEECRDYLPSFIYECRQCRIMACRRCRFNRL
ncbi:hypothetical protein Sste5346_006067 [Sporothrix stenoceras]|uniref:RBR-type E3 ubiquitin transferase n=1 Tax=Sporothrix stenoceras TaxID=5173 RepID=A0ABR3Z001_9PEZI